MNKLYAHPLFLIIFIFSFSSKSIADGKSCRALFTKEESIKRMDYEGYGGEAQKVNFSEAHTLDIPHYILRNLGTRVDLLSNKYDRFLVLVGEPSDYQKILESEKIIKIKTVKKSYGTHQLSEGVDKDGKTVLMISNLMVSEQVLRSQLLLKAANIPGGRIKTYGSLRSLKNMYVNTLKKMGASPDIVVYGFSGTFLNQILKLNSRVSLSRFKFSLAMFKKRKLSNRHSEWYEPFYSLQLADGTKVWLLTNVYGENSKFLFEALTENFNPKMIIALGTAGALHEGVDTGQFFTPRQILLEDGRHYEPHLQALRSSASYGTYARVQTPLVETESWLRATQTAGVDVVDVELGHIIDVHQKNVAIALKAAFLVSDKITLNNQENDLSKWNAKALSDSAVTLFNFLKNETERLDDESWILNDLQVHYRDSGGQQ